MQTARALCFTAFLFLLSACGSNYDSLQSFTEDQTSEGSNDFEPENPTDPTTFKPSICSELSFENISWPQGLTTTELNAFALAMNISGSFEGHLGWRNISNNFDGQGLSLGLFNQNLGQGSLQPLLITFRDRNSAKMKNIFSITQKNSLQSMLLLWGSSQDGLQLTKAASTNFYENDVSSLDDPQLLEENDEFFGKASNSRNQASVDWAVRNIYSGSSFKAEWKSALQEMAESSEYITLQVAAAKQIHQKATGLMNKYGFRNLRSYLFFFDIVVQNGGIPKNIENQYFTWVRNQPQASETTKLKRLLEYRLKIVRAEYVADVRARKIALIDGQGKVHGSQRNFQTEYCAPTWSTKTLP